jgi:hypothetical protein
MEAPMATRYDVAILSDLRLSGGTSASIVAEVRAQAATGVSTVLIHVPSPHLKRPRPFQADIAACLRGRTRRPGARQARRCPARLLVIRQPRIFTEDLPAGSAGCTRIRTVLILNQPPGDGDEPERYYRFADVRMRVERYFGPGRRMGAGECAGPASRSCGWRRTSRSPTTGTRSSTCPCGGPSASARAPGVPVIGRHGRPDPVKWPRNAEDLLRAYPETSEVRVRILGGGEIAERRLGRRPSTWDIVEFGTESPRDFLATLDFFVYFHDPGWVEAFGRTILEAMAAGCTGDRGTSVPFHLRRCRAVHRAGRRPRVGPYAARRSGAGTGRWWRGRGGSSRTGSGRHRMWRGSVFRRRARRGAVPAPAGPMAGRRRVLFLTDDLDRTLAIVPHLPADIEAVVAHRVGTPDRGAYRRGLLTEYVPSCEALGVPPTRWAAFLRHRLGHLVALHRLSAVVVDGLPHDGYSRGHRRLAGCHLAVESARRCGGATPAPHGSGGVPPSTRSWSRARFAANGDEGLTIPRPLRR